MEKKIPYKIYLTEEELPRAWYNLRADMKNKPVPLLDSKTKKPITAADLSGVFCDELIKQELDDETPFFKIPDEILAFYKMYRPAPLIRAYCLEKRLQTPAKIYYKFEGNNTSGSHKLNSAIAGVLREKTGLERGNDGNGRRAMGHGAVDGVRLFRARLQGVYGKMFLRTKALPQGSDAHLRRERNPLAQS